MAALGRARGSLRPRADPSEPLDDAEARADDERVVVDRHGRVAERRAQLRAREERDVRVAPLRDRREPLSLGERERKIDVAHPTDGDLEELDHRDAAPVGVDDHLTLTRDVRLGSLAAVLLEETGRRDLLAGEDRGHEAVSQRSREAELGNRQLARSHAADPMLAVVRVNRTPRLDDAGPTMTPAGPVLCCPDKFRGSLTADEAARALAAGVERTGREACPLPLADGGEGTLAVLCPAPHDLRTARVTGPLGEPVEARFGLRDGTAVVEMARASGLALLAGPNDPLRATTRGTGELIAAALETGAKHVIVAVGGSATVDGGLGALEALDFDLRGAEVIVACDVETTFVDAARVFGPQKGADAEAVVELERRLERLVARYRHEHGVDVATLRGAGAAGGLAGGLAAIGARLRPGAELVAEVVGLRDALASVSLVITGEGRFDATSLAGKVVGHVLHEAAELQRAAAVVAGDAELDVVPPGVACVTLTSLAGSPEVAFREAAQLAADAAEQLAAPG